MRAFDLGALVADIVILVLLAGGVAGVVFMTRAKPKPKPESQPPVAPPAEATQPPAAPPGT